VLVIGSGIIGLSTTITLVQKGYKVTIWAKDIPPNTTSNKAAAVWFPFLAFPVDKVTKWSSETMQHYKTVAVANSSSGVILRKTVQVFRNTQENLPPWKDSVPVRRATKEELGHGGTYVDGFTIEGVVADTDVYLEYLVNEVKSLGVDIIIKEVKHIQEALDKFDFIINCTGLGSRELLNDHSLFPTRGQTIIIKNKQEMLDVYSDDNSAAELAYIVPRTHTTVLGGTAQENDWNVQPSDDDTNRILKNCRTLSPHFNDVEIVQVKVGLRPTRPSIRLEPELFQEGKKVVIHNYGHGGSGFTVCWGCANEVAEILEKHTKV